MPRADCVFCERLRSGDLVAESPLAAAFPDAFPLSPGHVLIVPRRHEPDFWALRETEKAALWELVAPVKCHLESPTTRIPRYEIRDTGAGRWISAAVAC